MVYFNIEMLAPKATFGGGSLEPFTALAQFCPL